MSLYAPMINRICGPRGGIERFIDSGGVDDPDMPRYSKMKRHWIYLPEPLPALKLSATESNLLQISEKEDEALKNKKHTSLVDQDIRMQSLNRVNDRSVPSPGLILYYDAASQLCIGWFSNVSLMTCGPPPPRPP